MTLKNRFFHANTLFNSYKKHISAPLLRHLFEKKPGKAQISVIGLGFYRLFLNGKDITKGELAPYISNPDHYVYVDEYDVTDLLNDGENVVGLILGNGMQNTDNAYWEFRDNVFRSAPKFAFSLEIDGEEIFDAGSFVGPIHHIIMMICVAEFFMMPRKKLIIGVLRLLMTVYGYRLQRVNVSEEREGGKCHPALMFTKKWSLYG